MNPAKVAITLDEKVLKRLDQMVENRVFPNRSRAIQEAVSEKPSKMAHNRLARECAKLDPKQEQVLAKGGISTEGQELPEY